MRNPVELALVIGDSIYCEGIANAVLTGGLAASVDKLMMEDRIEDQRLTNADIIIVCAEGGMSEGVAAVRHITRRKRAARVALITKADWEERLDYINERRVGACVDLSIAGEQLVAVLRLMMDGFTII